MNDPAVQYRYTRVAIVLHWAIAAFILFNLATGFFMEGLQPPLKFLVILTHISSGMTVLALTCVRVAWRVGHRPPPFAFDLSAIERRLAHMVHHLLYLLMVAMPLTGWCLISANPPRGTSPPLWFMIPLPMIQPLQHMGTTPAGIVRQKIIHQDFDTLHSSGAYVMLMLLFLHVAGALKHQFFDKHDQFMRMGLGRGRRA